MEAAINGLQKSYRMGHLENIREGGVLKVKQRLQDPPADMRELVYGKMMGKHKRASDGYEQNDRYARIYAILASLAGLPLKSWRACRRWTWTWRRPWGWFFFWVSRDGAVDAQPALHRAQPDADRGHDLRANGVVERACGPADRGEEKHGSHRSCLSLQFRPPSKQSTSSPVFSASWASLSSGKSPSGTLWQQASGVSARGVVDLAKYLPEFAERGAQIERTSKIIGISADSYQRLAYAAKMSQTPVDAVYGALTKLNKAIGLGERGMGPAHQAGRAPGRSPCHAGLRTAKSSDEAFMDVADAISRTSDKMKQAAIVTAVFGKAGQQVLPMLLLGRKGLEQMKAAAVDVIPDKTLEAAEAFQRNMVRLKANVQEVKDRVLGFGLTLAEKYLPPIMKWLEANKEIIATRLEAFIDRLTTAFDNARPFLAFLLKAAGWLISNWPVLGAVYLGWIAAQIALDAALDANPIGLITLAIQALIVEVLIIIRYWHEITSVSNLRGTGLTSCWAIRG